MIRSLLFRNFKSLRDCRTTLEPLTVFVGRNGAGKTSVLQGTHYLAQLAAGKQPDVLFSVDRELNSLYSRGGVGPLVLQCCDTTDVQSRFAASTEEFEQSSQLSKPNDSWHVKHSFEYDKSVYPGNGATIHDAARSLGSTVLLKLDAAKLAQASLSDDEVPSMASDGSGLASVLANWKLTENAAFGRINEISRQLIPELESLSFQRARVWQTTFLASESTEEFARHHENFRARVGEQLVFNFRGAPGVPAPLASEGTLLTVGVLSVLLGPQRPRCLLLDDLGQALHPRAQVQLIELLRELMVEFKDLQILATAHSPYLLDCLSHEEVRLLTLDEQGGTVIGRLLDHPKFDKWKDEMAPGELWSLYGEKWVAEGHAVP